MVLEIDRGASAILFPTHPAPPNQWPLCAGRIRSTPSHPSSRWASPASPRTCSLCCGSARYDPGTEVATVDDGRACGGSFPDASGGMLRPGLGKEPCARGRKSTACGAAMLALPRYQHRWRGGPSPFPCSCCGGWHPGCSWKTFRWPRSGSRWRWRRSRRLFPMTMQRCDWGARVMVRVHVKRTVCVDTFVVSSFDDQSCEAPQAAAWISPPPLAAPTAICPSCTEHTSQA